MAKIPGKQSPLQFIDNVTIKANGTNKLKVKDVGQQISSSSGTFSTSSTSFVDVTNLSVTITTSGRPVLLMLIPDLRTSGPFPQLRAVAGGSPSQVNAQLMFVRDSTQIASLTNDIIATHVAGILAVSTPAFVPVVDTPVAGTYTYKVQAQAGSGTTTAFVYYSKLVAFEL